MNTVWSCRYFSDYILQNDMPFDLVSKDIMLIAEKSIFYIDYQISKFSHIRIVSLPTTITKSGKK